MTEPDDSRDDGEFFLICPNPECGYEGNRKGHLDKHLVYHVQCPQCSKTFALGVKCPNCGHVIKVFPERGIGGFVRGITRFARTALKRGLKCPNCRHWHPKDGPDLSLAALNAEYTPEHR